jgi:hypothetical protein
MTNIFLKIIYSFISILVKIITYLLKKVWDEVLRLLIWGAMLILIYFCVYKYLLN